MKTKITGFHQDEDKQWVAHLVIFLSLDKATERRLVIRFSNFFSIRFITVFILLYLPQNQTNMRICLPKYIPKVTISY